MTSLLERARTARAAAPSIALVFAGLVSASCASIGGADRGTLVIVGGGLRAENAEVIEAFTVGAGERVLVLPTASGVPDESGPGTAEDLRGHRDAGQSIDVLEILATTPERASDPHYVAALGDADALWFTGGVQSRITGVFRPEQQNSPAYRQTLRLLAAGGRIGGTSAGAAMMSDPMIEGGSSRTALLEGVSDGGFEMGQGMGYFPYGVVDQHFLRRGRIGRLVAAMEEAEADFGWGVADDRGLFVDRASDTGRPLGDRAVLEIDAREATRDGLTRRGLRIALLSSGDWIDFGARTSGIDASKLRIEPLDRFMERNFLPLDPFGRDTVTVLLERLSTDPSTPQRAEQGGIALVVRADDRTVFAADTVTLEGFSATGVILDVEIDPAVVADPLLAPRR